MNETNIDRADLLISLLVDDDATEQEWQEFQSLADRQPELWKTLAIARRHQEMLMRVVGGQVAAAESVCLPDAAPGSQSTSPPAARTPRRDAATGWLHRVVAWTGWPVAAVVGVAWLFWTIGLSGASKEWLRIDSPDDALSAYLRHGHEAGTVLGEWPEKLLIKSWPVETGEGFEVIYIRPLIERARVPDLFALHGWNEAGQPVLTPVQNPGLVE